VQEEDAPRLEELAALVGYAPHHFQRLFKRETGLRPPAMRVSDGPNGRGRRWRRRAT
jgi:methylphosphotriester-DNA--protein-cysteine methyltransferase